MRIRNPRRRIIGLGRTADRLHTEELGGWTA